jgi:protein-L-isoaspartate(D-aspartate) O-methyltransferase
MSRKAERPMQNARNPTGKVTEEQVWRACARVSRGDFVPAQWREQAVADAPVPIGFGQTTSQPTLIAWMISLLDLSAGDRVLEVGTGSGYQTAILAELGCVDVYSVEIIPELAESASERLQRLGYIQVHLKQGDGYNGWADHAPFDGILVSAACIVVPPPLLAQLADGGRLVIPLGRPDSCQILWKYVKRPDGLVGESMQLVAFVPLTGKALDAAG